MPQSLQESLDPSDLEVPRCDKGLGTVIQSPEADPVAGSGRSLW